jgi:hypothetical protein
LCVCFVEKLGIKFHRRFLLRPQYETAQILKSFPLIRAVQ